MGLKAQALVKSFGEPPTVVLKGLSFEVKDGEFVAITGRSGSGKSTLLYSLSLLDRLTSGHLLLDGRDTTTLSAKEKHRFLNLKLGFVFQFHYLLPELTCEENVLFPARKTNRHEALRKRAVHLMEQFEIGHIRGKLPGQISGGERQRAAIARALIMEPQYLFADEPTGNLDSVSGEKVMRIFEETNRRAKTTIIMVTHDLGYANRAKRRIGLKDGAIEFDKRRPGG
ncbi:MAG TPA: ABC transporter ATP-binding protein [bacterium]|nr:ABC transporter ATP-binding protein [bacterium]